VFTAWSDGTVQRLNCVDCDKQQPAKMSRQLHQAMCYEHHVQPSEGLLRTVSVNSLQRWADSWTTLNADVPNKWLSVEYGNIEAVTDVLWAWYVLTASTWYTPQNKTHLLRLSQATVSWKELGTQRRKSYHGLYGLVINKHNSMRHQVACFW